MSVAPIRASGKNLRFAADYYRFVTGELDKSAQTYQEWIENYPRDDAAYSALGITYASLGQYDKAEESYRQNLRLAPEVGAPYMNLGNCLLALRLACRMVGVVFRLWPGVLAYIL
jgi:tetratricopeptide (TPR) repeat protein